MAWTARTTLCFLCVLVCGSWRPTHTKHVMYGEVQSPQYPMPYAPNLEKQWDLSVPEGYQIQLTFTHLDIEPSDSCYYDAVTVVYDQNVLGRFCGQENSGNQRVLSPGNRLTLIFQSDDSNPEVHQPVGFSAHYQAIDIDECAMPEPKDDSGPLCSQICHNTLGSYICSCYHGYDLRPDQRTCLLSCGGGIFDELEGHLSSPGYPEHSPHGMSCQYTISVEAGFTVTLNFTDDFHIESIDVPQGPDCLHHWLMVTIPDRKPVKLCGGTSPGVMATNSNTVQLDYHTDWAGLSHGWSLDYNTHRVKCPFPNTVANGRVTPVLTEYSYRDYIHVRCNQGYKLMTDGSEIQSFSSMCQSNGRWHLPLPECQLIDCGQPEPLLNGGLTFISGSKNQYRSVIQYHCNKPSYDLLGGVNVSYTCASDRKWRDNNNVPVIPTCIPVCGEPTAQITGIQRILGGETAPANSIPWQVMLTVNGGRGGGIVIGDRWIMTAAHVLTNSEGNLVEKGAVKVYMGNNNVNELLKHEPANIASLHVHPKYSNYDNDIALIKLQQPLTFHEALMPICLPAEGAEYTTNIVGMVSGFGMTLVKNQMLITNKLKYVRIPIVDQGTCSDSVIEAKKAYRELRSDLTANMFCVGVPEAGTDSCQGDSGSAFALSTDGKFWVAGIVSWGVGCGVSGRYGVYTKVGNYVEWINKIKQDNQN
ncbi:complement component 1, r subcomponent [Lampris incognitus]|uniref:complement component 1, r subcomponent n=1 Tax=Lampris incognitus TaxID=2546036 RepID=UPI0024B4D4C9|nr:complement component 1, r subcomponent [Lampris incognitus]